MEPNGAIRAMVGGIDYGQSQFNRATKAKRQPGSAFKLFVYLAALEEKNDLTTQYMDSPLHIKGWSPENFTKKFLGNVTLEEAFIQSLNIVAIKIGQEVGWKKINQLAQRLGVCSLLHPHPSLALGTSEMTLLELTQAYAHIASRGKRVEIYGIEKIYNDKHKILYQHKNKAIDYVLNQNVVRNMDYLLTQVVNHEKGTGNKAKIEGLKVAGKTGTSQDFRDALFIGYVPGLITGIWVGNDDNKPMRAVTGGDIPATLWKQYNVKRISSGSFKEF